MKLVSKITAKHFSMLQYIPLQYMLRALEEHPRIGRVYENESACVVRIGSLLFFGGGVSDEVLNYVKEKILTCEIYEKYGVFYFFYPDEAWRERLFALYPHETTRYERALYCANPHETEKNVIPPEIVPVTRELADCPMLFVDLRQMNRGNRAPGEAAVKEVLERYLPGVGEVRRVPQGVSTYVYRAESAGKIYYARFLPEDSSFAAEVLAHKIALEKGVSAPLITAFEDKEAVTGLSLMVAEEIAGASVGDRPPENPKAALYEAGRQLALLHTIPVEGFGWIDGSSSAKLKGEKADFKEYFTEYLEDDLVAMEYYDFTPDDLDRLRFYMGEALNTLDTEQAVLVHGDMDVSHIFHLNGAFTGFIDFGEIRGCHPYFDLATFSLFCGGEHYLSLLEGYRSLHPMDGADLRAVELMALFIALRFAGKKVETDARSYWYEILKKQLKKVRKLDP